MLKPIKTGLTSRDLPEAKKPDPNFKPYRGPSITTANYHQVKILKAKAAEKITEVPVVDAADLKWEKPGNEFPKLEEGLEKLKADGICQGMTKAGSRCKRAVSGPSIFCPAHQLKPGDIILGE